MRTLLVSVILQLVFFAPLCGQHLEWLHAIEGDTIPFATTSPFPRDLALDKENNSYYLGTFNNKAMGYPGAAIRSSVIKYNERGDKCWHKNFDFDVVTVNAEDDSCNLYSLVYSATAVKIGNDSFPAPKGTFSLILIKSDSVFNIEWARLISDSVFSSATASKIRVTANNVFIFTNPGLNVFTTKAYFLFKGKNYYDKNYPNIYTNAVSYWLGLTKTKNGNASEWCSVGYSEGYLGTSSAPNFEMDAAGYLYCMINTSSFKFWFNDSLIPWQGTNVYWKQAILKINPNGKLENHISMFDSSTTGLNAMYDLTVLPSGKIFVNCSFTDSFTHHGHVITGKTPVNTGFLLLKNNGDVIWAVTNDSSSAFSSLSFLYTRYRSGNIYSCGFIFGGNAKVGGIPLIMLNPTLQSTPVVKMDTLGNVLWGYVLSDTTSSSYNAPSNFDIDINGNPYFTGIFLHAMSVLDTSVIVLNRLNTFIYKISDFSITRGDVYPGPYCAGDTFDIPYHLTGRFDTANVFIAQLSDEDGNFFGGERELGRLKANKDSVIKGVLPLFSVYTSGNYRIRILSTAPAAQSYYRQDTLRLLVYSRDSANAGPDTTICSGQKIRLKTTGGSKWEWSPGATLDDSTTYRPYATPLADTEYRIIISDSSGCGDIDTDYVKVYVRAPLELAINNDTTICDKGSVLLQAFPKGGRSAGYQLLWADSSGQFTDTNFTVLITPIATNTYTAILTDNCTVKPDTQKVTVSLRPSLALLKINSNDSICQNKAVLLNAVVTGGDSLHRSVVWSTDNSAWTSSVNPIQVMPLVNTTYFATLSDNCSPTVINSFKIAVVPVPVANFDVSPTTGCSPVWVTFTDKSTHNDTVLNIWRIAPAEALGVKTHTHPFYDSGTYTFGIAVSNAFGCRHDTTKSVHIEVYDKPIAAFSVKPDIKEIEEPLLFISNSLLATNYTWDFGDGNTLRTNITETTHSYTDKGNYTIQLIAETDKGCKDTSTQVIQVFDKIFCVIPNAFTPNGDNKNAVFAPVCDGIANYTLTIYNRWGQVLHNCNNCSWDGTFEGAPVSVGVYTYQLQLQGENYKKSTIYGTVNVLH